MKQFFLSFAVIVAIGCAAKAQQVTVINNTTCDIDVIVEGWDCLSTTGTVMPNGTTNIPAFGSQVFTDASLGITGDDFTINTIVDPSSTMPPPITFSTDVRSAPNSCIAPTVPVSTSTSTNRCGANPGGGIIVRRDASSTLATGLVIVEPY